MTKNTTKKATPAQKRPAPDSAAVLAGHISAILNHPDVPVHLYNALADAVCDLYVPKGWRDSVEHITILLANDFKEGGETDG